MNGWDRVPNTIRARCQVEDYLRKIERAPYIRLLRLARHLEVHGIDWPDAYYELRRLDAEDLNNEVLEIVRRREAEPKVKPTYELMPDGSLVEQPQHLSPQGLQWTSSRKPA